MYIEGFSIILHLTRLMGESHDFDGNLISDIQPSLHEYSDSLHYLMSRGREGSRSCSNFKYDVYQLY